MRRGEAWEDHEDGKCQSFKGYKGKRKHTKKRQEGRDFRRMPTKNRSTDYWKGH